MHKCEWLAPLLIGQFAISLEAAGLHRNTISNIEVGRFGGDPDTLASIEKVLSAAGVEFIDENGGGPACGCANA